MSGKGGDAAGHAAASGSQAIHRALRVLRILAGHGGEGCRLSDVAAPLGLNIATAHRILRALAVEGLVTQAQETRRYRLDVGYFRLADAATRIDLQGQLHPLLVEAAALFEDSFYLSVRVGAEVVCIDRVTGRYPIRVVPFDIGSRRPLGVGAAGIVMLAGEPPERAAAIMQENVAFYAQYALSPTVIQRMVDACRRNGFSYNPGRFIRGVSGVGVPVADARGVIIAAINATAIGPRLASDARRREIVGFLRTELTSRLRRL